MKNEDLLNINPKKDNKKPLIYAAIGFLIFIILVIAIAIFQNLSNSKNDEILPPAPKQETTQNTEEFKPLPVEEATNENKLVVEENTTNEATQETQTKPKTEEKPITTTETKPEKTEVKPEVKEVATQKPKTTTKVAPKEVTITIPDVKPSTPKVSKNGKYYIQVAALLRNAKPNKKFLALLDKYGYKYTTLTTYINKNGEKIKVTKLLVGPYATKTEAKKVLYKIKRDVTQNAFIYKAK